MIACKDLYQTLRPFQAQVYLANGSEMGPRSSSLSRKIVLTVKKSVTEPNCSYGEICSTSSVVAELAIYKPSL
jgi:hypothetical protein